MEEHAPARSEQVDVILKVGHDLLETVTAVNVNQRRSLSRKNPAGIVRTLLYLNQSLFFIDLPEGQLNMLVVVGLGFVRINRNQT